MAKDRFYTHYKDTSEDKKLYRVVDLGCNCDNLPPQDYKQSKQIGQTWLPCVIYADDKGNIYVREANDFHRCFSLVKED